MKLDYSSLERALAQLQTSFGYLDSWYVSEFPELRVQFRSATIQAFEYTYELSVKMISRQLAQIVSNPEELKGFPFAQLMRMAADKGVIRDASSFIRYREIRNKTSHTYNSEHAEWTVTVAEPFLRDVRFLVGQLERINRAAD